MCIYIYINYINIHIHEDVYSFSYLCVCAHIKHGICMSVR